MKKNLITSAALSIAFLLGMTTDVSAASLSVSPSSEINEVSKGLSIYVNFSGTTTELSGATKKYQVTTTSALPTTFGTTLPTDNKIVLNNAGKQYVHVRYQMADGSFQYVSGGPYNVAAGNVYIKNAVLVKEINGKYSVTAEINDSKGEVASVKAGTDAMNKATGSSVYKINGLTTQPTKVSVFNNENKEEIATFPTIPTVNMGTYKIAEKTQRGPINVAVTGTTGNAISYDFNETTQACGTGSCNLVLNDNGLFTVYQKNGVAKTGVAYSITNLDNSELELLMTGEREKGDEKTVNFEWNYPVTEGMLQCEREDGTKSDFGNATIASTAFKLTNVETAMDCKLKAKYSNVELLSNVVSIPSIPGADFENTTKYRKIDIPKTKVEESRVGTTYYVNTGSSGQKTTNVPLPIMPFK